MKSDGSHQGTALASNVKASGQLAVDGTYLYWTTQDSVVKMKKAGGSIQAIANGQTFPHFPVLGSGYIYWSTEDNAIRRVSINGGTVTNLAVGVPSPGAVAVDASNVYWVDETSVWKVGVGGGEPVQVAVDQAGPEQIVVDNTYLYWTNRGTANNYYHDGSVVRLHK
jgi:hypothetical protein